MTQGVGQLERKLVQQTPKATPISICSLYTLENSAMAFVYIWFVLILLNLIHFFSTLFLILKQSLYTKVKGYPVAQASVFIKVG